MVIGTPKKKVAPQFGIHLQPSGAILYETNTLNYFRLSGAGAELAMLMARLQDMEKTAYVWSHMNGLEEGLTVEELRDMFVDHPLTALWEKGILPSSVRITGSSQAYLPIRSTLQLTNACNLSCPFCYASSGRPYEKELTTEEWILVMEKLAANGVFDITITGGEARLVKGFHRLLATASCLFINVHLFSNGLGWTDDDIAFVKQFNNVRCQVSVDGYEETHDKMRGKKGAYKETMSNARKIAEAGIPLIIAMTVSPINYLDVEKVAEEACAVGARVFRAGITLPVGRAGDGIFFLSKEQRERVKEQIDRAIKKWGNRIVIPDWREEDSNEHHKGGEADFCTPGYLNWYVRADGMVTPCQIEEASMGHILKDSVLEIGAEERLLEVRAKSKSCYCIHRVELPEPDQPFRKLV